MLLKSIDHITINAKNINKSIDFYTKLFELEKQNIVDMGDHKLYYLGLPEKCRLEFISYDNPGNTLQTSNIDLGIYRHVAFYVDSVEEVRRRCAEMNVKINLGPLYIEKLNCTILLIEDPNGVELELIEKA